MMRHLVLVGAGFAHLQLLAQLAAWDALAGGFTMQSPAQYYTNLDTFRTRSRVWVPNSQRTARFEVAFFWVFLFQIPKKYKPESPTRELVVDPVFEGEYRSAWRYFSCLRCGLVPKAQLQNLHVVLCFTSDRLYPSHLESPLAWNHH